MAPRRKETRALFPHLSPPLPPLYILISHSLSLLVSVSCPLSPLLHCFPKLLSLFGFPAGNATHRTSTRSQEHTKYVPTPGFLHVVMFSKSCAANKAAWSQVSWGDLRRYSFLLKQGGDSHTDRSLLCFYPDWNTAYKHLQDWMWYLYHAQDPLTLSSCTTCLSVSWYKDWSICLDWYVWYEVERPILLSIFHWIVSFHC